MELSIGQMELALLRAQLDAFTQRFYKKAGSMYIKFDEARVQAARVKLRFDPFAQHEYHAAAEQWKLSKMDCQQALARPVANPSRLHKLHLEMARLFHPDLALDPVRKSLCEQLMKEVNSAVEDGDYPRLEAMRETIQSDSDAALEMTALTYGVPFQVNARNQYALRQGQDLLTDLTEWLYAQADKAQRTGDHNRPTRSFGDLMLRALEDAQVISVRLVQFPRDATMGQLAVRAQRFIDSPLTVLGQAQGMVRVPFTQALMLRISKDCQSLEPLRVLDAEDFNGLIDEWPDLVNLTDEMLQPLARFTRIEELHLARTGITGKLFDRFSSLHELRVLILDETSFDDHGMQRLGEAIWMQRLDLSSTRITGRGLALLHRMKSLFDLSLYATVVGDADLEVLESLPQLRNLNLGLTQVTDGAIDKLAYLHHLEVLHLGGTAVTDRALTRLAELPALRDLVLWETKISRAGLLLLTQCPTLRYLDVDQTAVTDGDLAAFRARRPDVHLPSKIPTETA